MSDENQKKIFAKNLNAYVEKSQKTQREVADSIGVSPQTFNTWCQGIALPRMGKLQRLADYFHIEKSDLIDEHHATSDLDDQDSSSGYYTNPETAKVAQEIFDNRELRILFDAARDAEPSDLRVAADLLKSLKGRALGLDNDD